MSSASSEPVASLCDPVLIGFGVPHGFGQSGTQAPENTAFLHQVHGIEVREAANLSPSLESPGDAVWSREPGTTVGVVTADCVPILLATIDGSVVAAIHAGWRGLAAGVIEAAMAAVRSSSATPLAAAIGPSARSCCYEVDEIVQQGLSQRYSKDLPEYLIPGRPGHFQLDLPALAGRVLSRNGVESRRIGMRQCVCTICSDGRFESYRRDAEVAGRMKHFVTVPPTSSSQG